MIPFFFWENKKPAFDKEQSSVLRNFLKAEWSNSNNLPDTCWTITFESVVFSILPTLVSGDVLSDIITLGYSELASKDTIWFLNPDLGSATYAPGFLPVLPCRTKVEITSPLWRALMHNAPLITWIVPIAPSSVVRPTYDNIRNNGKYWSFSSSRTNKLTSWML